MKKLMLFSLLLIGFLLLVGCSLDVDQSKDFYIAFNNVYDAPVTVEIAGGGTKEIAPFSHEVARITGKTGDQIGASLDGRYFAIGWRGLYLTQESMQIVLTADYGWIGLRNSSTLTLTFPKYEGEFFLYNTAFTSEADGYMSPGEIQYFRVDVNDNLYGDITFSVSGSLTRYRILDQSTYPAIGTTKMVTVYDTTEIEVVQE